MDLQQRITAFTRLGDVLRNLNDGGRAALAIAAQSENPWFTADNVELSLKGITHFLQRDTLTNWLSRYDFNQVEPKKIGVVMAGNIPLVGFHDFLCVLVSGHTLLAKVSSKDSALITYVANRLCEIEPEFSRHITFTTEQLREVDAVIATGSDNSARYFEYYFRKYPHIIRKNRTSVAILSGTEDQDTLTALGKDVFSYFGLGCRNVSKLFLPESFELSTLLKSWEPYQEVINHHKYANNYDYQKSIALVNKTPFMDNGFVLLLEDYRLVSPVSTVYYQFYKDEVHLRELVNAHREKIQCIVGTISPATVAFGKAQLPEVWDYADNVDTLEFLMRL
jgi:hypothetical protein